jgi:hypothetical protein
MKKNFKRKLVALILAMVLLMAVPMITGSAVGDYNNIGLGEFDNSIESSCNGNHLLTVTREGCRHTSSMDRCWIDWLDCIRCSYSVEWRRLNCDFIIIHQLAIKVCRADCKCEIKL